MILKYGHEDGIFLWTDEAQLEVPDWNVQIADNGSSLHSNPRIERKTQGLATSFKYRQLSLACNL